MNNNKHDGVFNHDIAARTATQQNRDRRRRVTLIGLLIGLPALVFLLILASAWFCP